MLGPPVCTHCQLFADYHPNVEYPNRQGEWLCPNCGLWCNNHLFEYAKEDQSMIDLATILFKENKGHSVS